MTTTLTSSQAEYVAMVRKGLEEGSPVHREILLDAARMIVPSVGVNERSAVLERIIRSGFDNGARD